jgi:hypothetical protein
MSPRKNNVITVEPWSKLRPGRLYRGRVKEARVVKKSNLLHVVIENLDPRQLGRSHQIDLPLPARPGNKVGVFLEACGFTADTAGKTICLDEVVGAMVGMRYRGAAANGAEEFDFEKIARVSSIETDRSHKEPGQHANP